MNDGKGKRRKQEKDRSARGEWKRLEKMLFIVQGERGIYTSVQKDWRRS